MSSNLEFLTKDSAGLSGFEDMSSDTQVIPSLRILQSLSPQLDETKPEYIEGAKRGNFLNSVTQEVLTSPVKVIVVAFHRRFTLWDQDKENILDFFSADEYFQHKESGRFFFDKKGFTDRETGGVVTESYTYYLLLADNPDSGIVRLTCTSTQIKEAKKWNRNLMSMVIPKTRQRAKPFHTIWALSSVPMQNDKGSWYSLKVDFAGWIDKDLFGTVQTERAMLSATSLKTLPQAEEAPALSGSESMDDVPF